MASCLSQVGRLRRCRRPARPHAGVRTSKSTGMSGGALTRARCGCQTGLALVRNIAHFSGQEDPVQIRLIAADPNSQPTNSPTLYRTDRDSWIVQGWVVTDPEVLMQMGIPEGETCVEIPDRMIPFFAEGD